MKKGVVVEKLKRRAFRIFLGFLIVLLFGCGNSDSEQRIFLKKLKAIVEHDDLSDAPFVEKTLGVKLTKTDEVTRSAKVYRLAGRIPNFASDSFRYTLHSGANSADVSPGTKKRCDQRPEIAE